MSAHRALSPRDRVELVGPTRQANDQDNPAPLVAIAGPTGSGKSDLALALAEKLDGEIVNYDSVQVYREFNIGSAKPPIEARRGIEHHLLDRLDPAELFTAGDYRREALRVLSDLQARRKLPVLVGGTGLYLRALLEGLFEGPQRSEPLRARLKDLSARRGREFLHRLLRRLDPVSARRIHPRDTQKIIRALEVCLLNRQPFSTALAQGRTGLRGFQPYKIGLDPNRKKLAERINRRVERMFAEGLMEETRRLLDRPDHRAIRPLEALGYRQARAALQGEISQEEAVRRTQAATRQYAKRQMTWFRREADIVWFAGFGDDVAIQRAVLGWLGMAAGFRSGRETAS